MIFTNIWKSFLKDRVIDYLRERENIKNISACLDFHLKPIAAKVKSYIKDTNDFLRKLQNHPKLPDDVILCMIDVVGLYPNIPNEKGVIP